LMEVNHNLQHVGIPKRVRHIGRWYQLVLANVLADPPPRLGLHDREMRAVRMDFVWLQRDKPSSSGVNRCKRNQSLRCNKCRHVNDPPKYLGQSIRGKSNPKELGGVLSAFRDDGIQNRLVGQRGGRSRCATNTFSKGGCDFVIERGVHVQQGFNEGDGQRHEHGSCGGFAVHDLLLRFPLSA